MMVLKIKISFTYIRNLDTLKLLSFKV